MATTTRVPILDETGKVRLWLNAGRGVAIWESKEIGVPRDMIDMLIQSWSAIEPREASA